MATFAGAIGCLLNKELDIVSPSVPHLNVSSNDVFAYSTSVQFPKKGTRAPQSSPSFTEKETQNDVLDIGV